jgi:hypothetical protein
MPREPDVPVDPLPPPATGDVNLPSPARKAQEASWRTHDSSLGQAEPEGELDEQGRRRAAETLTDRIREQGRTSDESWPEDCQKRNPPHG